MNSNENEFQKKSLPISVFKIGLVLSLLGLVLVVLAFYSDSTRATFNSLIIFVFLTSLGIGSLFLVALEYLAGAVWSVPFRRVSEFLSAIIFVAPLFAIPVILNITNIFTWTHTEIVSASESLTFKAPYLNEQFFFMRIAAIFLLWFFFYFLLIRNSRKQDISGDQKFTRRNIRVSGIFIPIFAITLSFIAIDWIMSLVPTWASTIFTVYYFAGTFLAAFSAMTYISVRLNEKNLLIEGVDKFQYYSMGAMLFAFINFWAYIAFSQFLLIWYGNLPQETSWFLARWHGGWEYISIGLIIIHFIVPYIALLSESAKSNPNRLKFMALWIIFAHFYDIYWLVIPTYNKCFLFSWYEISFIIFAIGVVALVFYISSKGRNLVAINDPKLIRSLEQE
jgi:hypothetical protein